MTTLGSIDQGGYNRLKPLVKTRGGFDCPTLLQKVIFFSYTRSDFLMTGIQMLFLFIELDHTKQQNMYAQLELRSAQSDQSAQHIFGLIKDTEINRNRKDWSHWLVDTQASEIRCLFDDN